MTTNCKNCGAPLKGGKCEYCSTEYADSPRAALYFKDEWAEHNADTIHDLVMQSILTPNEAKALLNNT